MNYSVLLVTAAAFVHELMTASRRFVQTRGIERLARRHISALVTTPKLPLRRDLHN
jgi:hypothetical protein